MDQIVMVFVVWQWNWKYDIYWSTKCNVVVVLNVRVPYKINLGMEGLQSKYFYCKLHTQNFVKIYLVVTKYSNVQNHKMY